MRSSYVSFEVVVVVLPPDPVLDVVVVVVLFVLGLLLLLDAAMAAMIMMMIMITMITMTHQYCDRKLLDVVLAVTVEDEDDTAEPSVALPG